MAEDEDGSYRRDGGHTPIPPPPPDAATEQHDRHAQSTSTIRMIVMDSRFRQHGLKVDASTHIDGDEPLVSGKVIMALGSKDDMLNEVRVADQDPDKYMIGEESELVIRSGEVYTWLLRIGDSVTHDPNGMRGSSYTRPKRAAAPGGDAETTSFTVGNKVLVPVLTMFPGGSENEDQIGDELFLATISGILIVIPAVGASDIDYENVNDDYFKQYKPVKGERTTQATVFLYLSSYHINAANGYDAIDPELDEEARKLQLREPIYHPSCIVCKKASNSKLLCLLPSSDTFHSFRSVPPLLWNRKSLEVMAACRRKTSRSTWTTSTRRMSRPCRPTC